MAEVTLSIGGRSYNVHCGDGEEGHMARLARMVDEKTIEARRSAPGLTEVRQLLFAAILLADEIHDLRAKGHVGQGSLDLKPVGGESDTGQEMIAQRMTRLAERIETLTEQLAGPGATP